MDFLKIAEKDSSEYLKLINKYLPLQSNDSIWAQSMEQPKDFPSQGFKIHVSASIIEANQILKNCIPIFKKYRVVYKACKDIAEIKKINSGIHYGYEQTGKVITVYPKDESTFLKVAQEIDSATSKFKSIDIPYDIQFSKNSNVFYRYGAFIKSKNNKGKILVAGKYIIDKREFGKAIPKKIINPFPVYNINSKELKGYILLDVLSKRGKGSVFKAISLKEPLKNCIIKEGTKNGEIYYDKKDGFNRIKYEAKILDVLRKNNISVPNIIETFSQNGNYYLAMEHIMGINLRMYILKNKSLSYEEFKYLASQILKMIKSLHNIKYVWRDCKPDNFIINSNTKEIRPIDFEGVCKTNTYQLVSWSSPGFSPPDLNIAKKERVNFAFDYYSVGCLFYFMVTKKILFKNLQKLELLKVRRGFPKSVITNIIILLSESPHERILDNHLEAFFFN